MGPDDDGGGAWQRQATSPARPAAVVLCALALVYVSAGLWLYAVSGQGDMRLRWAEKAYVLHGIDPLNASRAEEARALGLPPLDDNAGYAPWSYVYAVLLEPGPDPDVASIAFGALNAAALVVLACFGYRYGRAAGRTVEWGALGGAGMLAFLAVPVVLRHGNYGLLVTAMLAGMVACLDAKRPVLAGVLLGLAMVKPQLAALFGLVPLVRGEWRCLLAAAAVVLAAWLGAAELVHESPLAMLSAMLRRGSGFADAYQGIFAGINLLGVPRATASVLGLVLGGAITAALAWRYRRSDTLSLAATAGVMATVWSYHRTHDLMILGFLGLASIRVFANSRVRVPTAAYAVLLTPWLPYFNRFNVGYAIPTVIRLVWFSALLTMLTLETGRPVTPTADDAAAPLPRAP